MHQPFHGTSCRKKKSHHAVVFFEGCIGGEGLLQDDTNSAECIFISSNDFILSVKTCSRMGLQAR